MPFGNEFLYNHPACLLAVFNWDKSSDCGWVEAGSESNMLSLLNYALAFTWRNWKTHHIHAFDWNAALRAYVLILFVLSARDLRYRLPSLIVENIETTKCIDPIKENVLRSNSVDFKFSSYRNSSLPNNLVWSVSVVCFVLKQDPGF